jgi:hypothetical protein
MNPKNRVAPDQDAAAVSAHADASIASITAVGASAVAPSVIAATWVGCGIATAQLEGLQPSPA